MAESKQETDLETIYDEKERLLQGWYNKIQECTRLISDLGVSDEQIDEYLNMDPDTIKTRYSPVELEVLLQAGRNTIMRLGYRSEFNRVQKSMADLEGRDIVTGNRSLTPNKRKKLN